MARINVRDLPERMQISAKEMRQVRGGSIYPRVLRVLPPTVPLPGPVGGIGLASGTALGSPRIGPFMDPRVAGCDSCANAVAGIRG
jgi:hypothetical protein